jgi:AcrR family transcriptional regulator
VSTAKRSAKEASAKDASVAQPVKRRAYMPAAERRKSIIAAAQEVFARSNLKGARTRDIARAAAVNQATIFEHFPSKEALFQEAVVQPLIDAMRGMHARRETYEAAESPDELASLAFQSATHHVEDMVEIFPLFTAALVKDWRDMLAVEFAP